MLTSIFKEICYALWSLFVCHDRHSSFVKDRSFTDSGNRKSSIGVLVAELPKSAENAIIWLNEVTRF